MGLSRCPANNWTPALKTLYSKENQRLIALLREARHSAGITQTQLSEKLGKPQSYVSKYENGERKLDVIEFLRVCREINVDPHEIIIELTK